MKNKKIILITVTLIIASALLLVGSMALIANALNNEAALPEGSAVPNASSLAGLPSDERIPTSVNRSEINEVDGKKVVTVLSEEELNLLAERRANGEWLTLPIEEMTAVVKDTIELFYSCDRIEVGSMTDGVYGVTSYNGALYYTSDEFAKYTWSFTPETFHDQTWIHTSDVRNDVMAVILARLSAYSDSVGKRDGADVYYAVADVSDEYAGKDDEYMIAACSYGHAPYARDYLLIDIPCGKIILHNHASDKGYTDFDKPCCEEVNLLGDDRFETDFVEQEFVEGSRRVRVEIFDEASKELVGTFTITDQDEVSVIFDAFFTAFGNVCSEFEKYLASEEDKAYRSDYRIVVNLESTYENVIVSYINNIDICYPYGYSNDVYGYMHDDRWIDYSISGGSDMIGLIDIYVGQYIPE